VRVRGTHFGRHALKNVCLRRRVQYSIQKHGVFLVCKVLYRELHMPWAITVQNARGIFGPAGMPVTRTPPAIDAGALERLQRVSLIRIRDE
jgi:hypothetical protein